MNLPEKRSTAKEQGLTRYFTGKPCTNGHTAERMVSSGACVECNNARRAVWRSENRDSENARKADWQKRNPEKARASKLGWNKRNAAQRAEKQRNYRAANLKKEMDRQSKWLANNPEKMRSINADWYRKNRHIVAARDARRRANEVSATWDDELTELVAKEAVDLAKVRQLSTGFAWHIDHMIPLKAKKVCGLHTWANLQVIPARLNLSKGNRLWLVIPGEWVRHA